MKTIEAYRDAAVQQRRDELILAHLPLVRHVVGRLVAHLPAGLDVENLESAGTLGLVEAARLFDPGRGADFKTYATVRIRGAVLDELRRNCPLPQHMLERAAQVRQAQERLGGPATVEALAEATGLDADEVCDCLAALRLAQARSPEDPLTGYGCDIRTPPPDASAELTECRRMLAEAIESLPERERLVVTLYYVEDLRLREIATVLGLSESRTSRVLQSALFRLQELMQARGL